MFWKVTQPEGDWIYMDGLYLLSLFVLVAGLWRYVFKRRTDTPLMWLGLLLVGMTFFSRFSTLLSADSPYKDYGLARCVLHTLLVPTGLVVTAWLVVLGRDLALAVRNRWQTSALLGVALFLSFWIVRCAFWIFTRFGNYPGPSAYP